ncbi:MAG: acyl-CoA dehydrogenase, partial [Actinobacteria bacterium]|nr:acyl-CoA dehydrogenase [Actinomycetota bacterium]
MSTFEPDLHTAASIISAARGMVDKAIASLVAKGGPDAQQTLAYDIAHVAAQVETARSLLDYGAKGTTEGNITCAFTADMAHDFITRLIGRESLWGVQVADLAFANDFLTTYRDPAFLASLADVQGPRHLADDFEMVQDTFRSYAMKVIAPKAEHVHRFNEDVPEDVIAGLAEIGAFGLSVPVEYDGFSEGGEGEYMASVIATEELSRGSLGIGGSLITRPEILTRALVKGGTEEQKHEWLPKLASAEVLSAVAVTEPDYGSDVAGLKTTAVEAAGPNGEAGWLIN